MGYQGQRAATSVRRLHGAVLALALLALLAARAAAAPPVNTDEAAERAPSIEEITVVASRSVIDLLGTIGSSTIVDSAAIDTTGALHVNEAVVRVPGVWVSRGSGQEHLTAIRSAVLTGPGACGAFALLEDGIPIRPSGFCNVNNLFELNTEQAQRIEFLRGPGSAVLGGNALRGAINMVSPTPRDTRLRVEGGSYDYLRVALRSGVQIGESRLGIALHSDHWGGYRDDTGYGQQKLNLTQQMRVGNWNVLNTFSGTLLNQETGGFVRGDEAYDDSQLRRTNPNPEAYRDAWALRAASHWERGAWTITPYARRSQMAFLQHFLPGQPLEENEQTSAGVLGRYQFESDRVSGSAGLQVELMRSALKEDQDGPTIGSAFLVETRPSGLHYDYDVDSTMVAGFYDLAWSLGNNWRIEHSARVERLEYDYDNNTLVGNTREDGSTCGFGGCRYTRPASGDDTFTDIAGRIGLVRLIGNAQAYAMLGSGFRAPQATELYRLQDGQLVTDLDSEDLLALEVGFKTPNWSVALFRQRTRNLIFRDSDGFNVSDGRTKALGVEFAWQATLERHQFDVAASYARHEYDYTTTVGFGEQIDSGNDVDTAPRWLGSARWGIALGPGLAMETELVHVGKHYTNASNTAEYDGHWLVHWRGSYALNDSVRIFARVHNLLDERYAERADFAFGSDRYFPGMPRQFYLGMDWQF